MQLRAKNVLKKVFTEYAPLINLTIKIHIKGTITNTLKKKKMTKKVQEKFYQFLEPLEIDLNLPEQKFLKAISKGILGNGSVIVRQIGQQLEESIDLKKRFK